jgi:hypothetical protein
MCILWPFFHLTLLVINISCKCAGLTLKVYFLISLLIQQYLKISCRLNWSLY